MSVHVVLFPLPDVVAPRFRIFMLGENDSFPTLEYLENLKQSNEASHGRLIAQLGHVSENGPITNDKRKSRILHHDPKIYEFKTKDQNRITWFYDKNQMILCTHGFRKPKPRELQQEIKVAVSWHARYFEAKAKNQLIFESDE
jgi:hypothetical protein